MKIKKFVKEHKDTIIGVVAGATATAYIIYKVNRLGDSVYPNKMTFWFDDYLPGLNTLKDRAIESAWAVVEYDDGTVDVVDDILGLAERLGK